VGLVVCLDSGAGNYDQLWLTTSLRGMASGTLKVEILTEGVHSGDASGLVPSFPHHAPGAGPAGGQQTGRLLPASFHCEVPAERLAQARPRRHPGRRGVQALPWAHYDCGGSVRAAHHHRPGRGPAQAHLAAHAQRHRRRGLPPCRTPATCCAPTPPSSSACACRRWWTPRPRAAEALLEDNAPYQAKVTFDSQGGAAAGTPHTAPWFEQALDAASQAHFGAPCGYIGQGGTIR
jgi:hypothetical protein